MKRRILICISSVLLFACGGGGGGNGGPAVAGSDCSGSCAATTPTALTVAEVERIVSQAVLEAQSRGMPATIGVVDRSGRVLAVYRMTGAMASFTISGGRDVAGGLEAINTIPAEYAAISKALTGAYLSSEGNAFSTRTASQIVQQNFNPGESGAPGGPLFGVQFSSLSCSDIVQPAAATAGPKGSPLGLAADPGGLPLYKNGTLVGGIGVMADGLYGLDANIGDSDSNIDELIAVAGSTGFGAPTNRRADHISVEGRSLRYTDSEALLSTPALAPPVAPAATGSLIAVTGYKTSAAAAAGIAFNTASAGFRADTSTPEFAGLGAYVLDNGAGANRFPPTASAQLSQAEVARILAEAIKVANHARAQIRLPLGSTAQVSIALAGVDGALLGLVRTPDAPVFSVDVSVQKARSALLFSSTGAAAALNALPAAHYPAAAATSILASYITRLQAFIPGGTALADGIAYSSRSIANLARPFFPDGINGNAPGPLSKPFTDWSPFSTGLQLDLVIDKLVANLGVVPSAPCSFLPQAANGIQIFPGGVPIFRGNTLVGAIGVSGDGIDQDEMIAFLGLANAGKILDSGIGNAPAGIRADTIAGLPGGQLRYVNCPIAPFVDTTASNVCNGI